jgi:hypothetical protein
LPNGCGNGVVDPGEDCEYAIFDYLTFCHTLPNVTGDALVACSASTCRYNLSNCTSSPAPVCGNGIRESDEQCDGDDWMARSCTERWSEYTGGRLSCNQATCQLDVTQCARCDGTRCGDGVIDPVHGQCDGANLGTHSCLDLNRLNTFATYRKPCFHRRASASVEPSCMAQHPRTLCPETRCVRVPLGWMLVP